MDENQERIERLEGRLGRAEVLTLLWSYLYEHGQIGQALDELEAAP